MKDGDPTIGNNMEYFSLEKCYSNDAFRLHVDYELIDVPDPLAINQPRRVGGDFLKNGFRYRLAKHGILEDLLFVNMGWYVFSNRVIDIIFSNCEEAEYELCGLPDVVSEIDARLSEYMAVGFKRRFNCLNEEVSGASYMELDDLRSVESVERIALRPSEILAGVTVFWVRGCLNNG